MSFYLSRYCQFFRFSSFAIFHWHSWELFRNNRSNISRTFHFQLKYCSRNFNKGHFNSYQRIVLPHPKIQLSYWQIIQCKDAAVATHSRMFFHRWKEVTWVDCEKLWRNLISNQSLMINWCASKLAWLKHNFLRRNSSNSYTTNGQHSVDRSS